MTQSPYATPGPSSSPGPDVTLDNEEILRYSRHLLMPEVTLEGQRRLKAAKVLCVGAGGLGSPLTLYLAAAGVGTLGVVEFDTVDLTNLQRQVLYTTADVGRPKLDAAVERLRALNPDITVVPHRLRLDSGNVLELFRTYDVIADGTDNFPTRYLVNDASRPDRVSPTSTPASSASTGRSASSAPPAAPATGACSPSRPRPASCRPARRAGCWACCPASSARSRRSRSSS